MTQSRVKRVRRTDGVFELCILSPSQAVTDLSAEAVILATGFDHIDARTKGPYGFGILPAVTTGHEMERRLLQEGQAAYDGMGLGKVAFIQCVGSRDEHAGRGYCSQVCCRYALRLARLLKQRLPDVEITIHKMDIQTSGRDFRSTWDAVKGNGIRIVAGLPAVVRRSPEHPQRAEFLYDDILGSELARDEFDLVVLSVGMEPRQDAAEVAEQFGVNRDVYGFFAAEGPGSETIVPGVFAAGCCEAPRSIAESVAHAQQVAQTCYAYLKQRDCSGR
jgi:heterodisulfide reductase subunit A